MTETTTHDFATLHARCQAAGVTLLRVKDEYGAPCFMVSRWTMTRDLPTLEAVGEWLDRVSGRATK